VVVGFYVKGLCESYSRSCCFGMFFFWGLRLAGEGLEIGGLGGSWHWRVGACMYYYGRLLLLYPRQADQRLGIGISPRGGFGGHVCFALLFFFFFFCVGSRYIVTTKERNSFIGIMSGIYCKWQSPQKKYVVPLVFVIQINQTPRLQSAHAPVHSW